MTKIVSPFDSASFSALNSLTNSSPPSTDLRGTSWGSTGFGAMKYDSTLLFINKPKFSSPFDQSSFSAVVTLTNSSPPSTDIRGVSWGSTGFGAMKYSSTLAYLVGFSHGDYVVLPTDDSDLLHVYSSTDVTNVSSKDAIRVAQTGSSEYMVHQFKFYVGVNPTCSIEWLGQTDLAASSSTVYFQIYNRVTPGWETKASNNTTGANTDIDLTAGGISLTNYKSTDNVISLRVYQQATG